MYEFSPFGLAWGAAALIEFPAVALALGMVVGLDSWFRTGSYVGLLTGVASGWLAFLVKATTPPAWCVLVLISAATAFEITRSWKRSVIGMVAGPVLDMAIGLSWAHSADVVKDRNPLARFLTSDNLWYWNFGAIDERLNPLAYGNVLARIALEIAGPLGFGLFLAVRGTMLAPKGVERARCIGWLAVAATAPLIFFNLYRVHSYYLIAIFPALVAAVAVGVVAVCRRMGSDTAVIAAALTAFVVLGSAVPYNVVQWLVPPAPDPAGERIKAATRPDDLVVMVGCDWDPSTLYFADRRGLMLTPWNHEVWSQQNVNDYRDVFTCDLGLPVADFLPAGHVVQPTPVPGLWQITSVQGTPGGGSR